MNARDIIIALGGATKLSAATSLPRSRIANWQSCGIPGQYWPLLERVARKVNAAGVTMATLETHRGTERDAA